MKLSDDILKVFYNYFGKIGNAKESKSTNLQSIVWLRRVLAVKLNLMLPVHLFTCESVFVEEDTNRMRVNHK